MRTHVYEIGMHYRALFFSTASTGAANRAPGVAERDKQQVHALVAAWLRGQLNWFVALLNRTVAPSMTHAQRQQLGIHQAQQAAMGRAAGQNVATGHFSPVGGKRGSVVGAQLDAKNL